MGLTLREGRALMRRRRLQLLHAEFGPALIVTAMLASVKRDARPSQFMPSWEPQDGDGAETAGRQRPDERALLAKLAAFTAQAGGRISDRVKGMLHG